MLVGSYSVNWCQYLIHFSAFVTTPTSVNAILGSTATFNCSATAGAVVWMVNGSLLTQLNTDNTDIRTSSVGPTFCLHIPATEKYNNTNVVCRLAIPGVKEDDLYSDPVVPRVQGMFCMWKNILLPRGTCSYVSDACLWLKSGYTIVLWKSVHRGVGSLSAFNHERAPLSCWQQLMPSNGNMSLWAWCS